MLDKASALLFQTHALNAIKELSSALLVAQKSCNQGEFVTVKRSIGDAVVKIDDLLRETIYVDYPEMDDLKDH